MSRRTWTAGLALTAALLAACGGDDGSETGAGTDATTATTAGAVATTRAPAGGSAPKPCLSDADVSGPVGFAVALLRETVQSTPTAALCTYQPTDRSLGTSVEVTIAVGPASAADQVIRDFTVAAKARSGKGAEALAVGDRGFAFGSSLSSSAVAVKGDRVVAISISSPFTSIGDKKAAAVEILRKVLA